ncbi:MAG: type I-E CRISPR-associated protein Cse2/CasB [Balneolales bacterium]
MTHTDKNTLEKAPLDFDEISGEERFRKYDVAVGKIASMMQQEHGGLGTGEMADLRRISPEKPFTAALWRILLDFDLDKSPQGVKLTDWERKWATLLMGMAVCNGLHVYEVPFGRALADSGWSELRFAQLMQATGKTLEIHLRRVAQFLASKGQKANWAEVRKLLFYQEGEFAEDIRLSISRHYYQAIYQSEHKQS